MSDEWQVHAAGSFYDCGEPNVVYYDPASGDTHLLSAFSAHILRRVIAGPVSTATLLSELSADVEAEDREELADALPRLLRQLVGLGVIEGR